MASITIRNLEESVKNGLRVRAALHGCSMEEEARKILRHAVLENFGEKGLGSFIHRTFAGAGGVELTLSERSEPRICDFG